MLQASLYALEQRAAKRRAVVRQTASSSYGGGALWAFRPCRRPLYFFAVSASRFWSRKLPTVSSLITTGRGFLGFSGGGVGGSGAGFGFRSRRIVGKCV